MLDINEILSRFDIQLPKEDVKISQFSGAEDGSLYDCYLIDFGCKKAVLKRAKNHELEVYSAFFRDNVIGAPKFIGSANFNGNTYILIEYADGVDLRACNRDALKLTLDALISLQDKFWDNKELSSVGLTYKDSLGARIDRGRYLNDKEIEKAYAAFLDAYSNIPRTLCHDDLLPFNVIVGDEATIIDWEYAGILPYLTSIARLIAHTEDNADAFFYMSREDYEFAIQYYYENFISRRGIAYDQYRRDLDLFILYEYCEWIMLGNKYPDADMMRMKAYYKKAYELIKKLQ